MSRNDNMVRITGKVVRGPIVRYTDAGKCRCFYQVEIKPRKKDNGMIQVPFIRSVGNQAEKDRDNIKIGDLITVEGRIITRDETRKVYFIKDKDNPQTLIPIDPNDEEAPFYKDEDLLETTITRPVTEIFAEDVMYFHEYLYHLTDEEKVKLFTPKVLKEVVKEYEENGGSFKDLQDLAR